MMKNMRMETVVITILVAVSVSLLGSMITTNLTLSVSPPPAGETRSLQLQQFSRRQPAGGGGCSCGVEWVKDCYCSGGGSCNSNNQPCGNGGTCSCADKRQCKQCPNPRPPGGGDTSPKGPSHPQPGGSSGSSPQGPSSGGGNGGGGNGGGGSASCPAPAGMPTQLHFTCSGNQATVSWTADPAATYYSLRVDNRADGWDGTCRSNTGDMCREKITGTSATVTITPGAEYRWFLHSRKGCTAAFGPAAFGPTLLCGPSSATGATSTPSQSAQTPQLPASSIPQRHQCLPTCWSSINGTYAHCGYPCVAPGIAEQLGCTAAGIDHGQRFSNPDCKDWGVVDGIATCGTNCKSNKNAVKKCYDTCHTGRDSILYTVYCTVGPDGKPLQLEGDVRDYPECKAINL